MVQIVRKVGVCQDPYCEEPREPVDLVRSFGRWRCIACAEAEYDAQECDVANAPDFDYRRAS